MRHMRGRMCWSGGDAVVKSIFLSEDILLQIFRTQLEIETEYKEGGDDWKFSFLRHLLTFEC